MRYNEIKFYEIYYADIKPYENKSNEIKFYGVKFNQIKFDGVKAHEVKSYDIEFNEDYCIENIKNEFNKLSNKLVQANIKDIRYIVDIINNGENLKKMLFDLEGIKDKFIVYNDTLPF